MRPIEELLAKRDEIKLCWVEPWGGVGPDWKNHTVTMEFRATVADCINMERGSRLSRMGKLKVMELDNSDECLLLDFIAIHWSSEAP